MLKTLVMITTYDNTNLPKWSLRRIIVHLNSVCSNAKSACSTVIESIPLKGASAPNVLQLQGVFSA